MAIDHKNIPDAELHNLKGFAGASNNTLPRKDNVGNYNWAQVDSNTLANDAVTAAKIAAGAVGSSEIASNAVTTAKIADSNVTNAKLAGHPWGAEDFQTGTEERDWVLARTSAATAGAVGTYAFAVTTSATTNSYAFGSTISGGSLDSAGVRSRDGYSIFDTLWRGTTLSGTWRCVGAAVASSADDHTATLWLRIS